MLNRNYEEDILDSLLFPIVFLRIDGTEEHKTVATCLARRRG